MFFLRCPRCKNRGFERFSKYGICHDCNYFELKGKRSIALPKIKKQNEDYERPNPFCSKAISGDRFTEEDHKIVRKALLSIPEKEQRIVFLHFWKDLRRHEIAERVHASVEQVEKTLSSAYERLRLLCVQNPKFSRSIRALKMAA